MSFYFFSMFKETVYFSLEQYDPLGTCATDSTFYAPLSDWENKEKN